LVPASPACDQAKNNFIFKKTKIRVEKVVWLYRSVGVVIFILSGNFPGTVKNE
jgi:hypothetical protein